MGVISTFAMVIATEYREFCDIASAEKIKSSLKRMRKRFLNRTKKMDFEDGEAPSQISLQFNLLVPN